MTKQKMRSEGANEVPQKELETSVGHMDTLLDSLKARPCLNLKEAGQRPKRQLGRNHLQSNQGLGNGSPSNLASGPHLSLRKISISQFGETALNLLGALEGLE